MAVGNPGLEIIQGFLLKGIDMRITGLRTLVSKDQLVSVLKKHTTKDKEKIRSLAQDILNGFAVDLEDDWALEQDLKDLGVRVE